ncbi:hypothetical protein Cni_G21881 [Canna indica]|uniref:Uncharacterized protein n=1 Tax=Canna indica TaxID=4628 RepID=A0AAQ3KWS2_9LILI|nr:hypothetical protein Cni_G21881 [Canna indica]
MSDCLRLMRILRNEFDKPWDILVLIRDIKKLACGIGVVKWQYVSRDKNKEAHMLARGVPMEELNRRNREVKINAKVDKECLSKERDCSNSSMKWNQFDVELNKMMTRKENTPAYVIGEGSTTMAQCSLYPGKSRW